MNNFGPGGQIGAPSQLGVRPDARLSAGFLSQAFTWMFAGLLLTAAANSIWMGYGTYGLGLGVGTACVNVPMLATIGGWFERQRAAALGLAATGIAAGTMIGSPLSATLIDAIGFRATFVVYAAFVFVTLAICALMVERAPARPTRALRPGVRAALRDLVRDPSFARLYLSSTMMSMVVFVPMVFLTGYASDNGAGEVEAAVLLGVMGGASIIGRLGMGFVVPRVDMPATYRASFVAITAALLLWLSADGEVALLWGFAVVFGIAYGAWRQNWKVLPRNLHWFLSTHCRKRHNAREVVPRCNAHRDSSVYGC